MTVYTMGHSTRSLEEFLALLQPHGIAEVVDVRHYPSSRHNPQYNSEPLAAALRAAGLEYVSLPQLGGRRPHRPNSLNLAWQNEAFRAYADYMATDEFAEGLEVLMAKAQAHTVCVMCAGVLPWRCHRRLIADALLVRGASVEHLIGPGVTRSHVLTPWAEVVGQQVTYPGPAAGASSNEA